MLKRVLDGKVRYMIDWLNRNNKIVNKKTKKEPIWFVSEDETE